MMTSDNSQINLFDKKDTVSNISTDDLVKIVEKASTIFERVSAEFVPKNFEEEQNLINSRLEKWCQVSANGNQQKFIKRLTWDGIDIDKVRRALGNVSLVDQQYLPSWTNTLREAMEIASSIGQKIFTQSNTEQRQYIDVKEPLPFEEIFIPFIDTASKKLIECTGSSYELLSATAHAQLERSLLKQLSTIFALPLDLEFSLFRSCRGSQLARLIEQLQKNSSKSKYIEFVQNLLNDGLLSFFQEYSVVARLAATVTDFWVEAVGEFLHRLASDWEKIQQSFQKDRELGQVVAVEASLSDPHNRGRSVFIVKFASNLKLVYKPKNLGLEQAYFEFISWINQQGATLPLKVLNILNCSTYGWIEFVEALPCKNQQAVKSYYQRAGMLLCITYALRGTDFHYENLIACEEQPILIDLETLFHHDFQIQKEDNRAISLAQKELRNSVTATALLPGAYLPVGQTGELVLDICGLGNIVEQQITMSVLKWNYINTDSMMMVVEKETEILANTKNNQPFGKGVDTLLSHHSEELIAGFQQMYRFLMQRKEALLAIHEPLATFACQKVRLVLRNTSLYISILSNSLHYKCLRDGVERSIELDILSRSFLASEDKDPLWPILVAEKQAIEQLDIPYISSYSNSNDIILNSETTIEKFFKGSSYDSVVSRIQELSEENLAGQISLIKSSLYSYLTDEHPDESTLQNSEMRLNTVVPLEEEAILQQAIAIAQELQHRAIRGSENDVAWIGIRYVFELKRFQLRPLGFSLYDGCCGISLFLAALANVTDKPEFGELALGSLHYLREIVYEKDPQVQKTLTENMGIGGARGLASIVYAFVRIADLLGDTRLIEDAKHIASWMTVDKTTANQAPGLIHGAAGVILSLLALYNATKKRETLVQAMTWGQHLLDTRVTTSAGHQLWTNSDGEPLIGFSEGIAGIAYALVQLYAVTKDSVFLCAAQQAVHYEQSSFSLRGDFLNSKKDTLSSINSWCSGLAGMILARLGGLAILDPNEIRQELEIDLQQMLQSELQVLDNLCCGNLGYIDALLVAAERLSRPELREIAHKQIALVLHRSNQVGSFQLLPNLSPDIYNPCFCQGTAGIGYELLRFLYPQKLTSVLLWQ